MRVAMVAGGGYEANQYLVEADGEALLVDVGTGIQIPRTLSGLDAAIGDARLVGIYLTHWHVDHVGAAAALHEALGAELLMPGSEAHAVREGRGDLTLADAFGLPQRAADVTGVEPGEKIALAGETLEVLGTPGHTAGHTSLWHAASRTLVAGDAVFRDGGFGRVDLPTGSESDMLQTLRMLGGLRVERLYAGHMDPVPEGAARHVELALENARGMFAWSERATR